MQEAGGSRARPAGLMSHSGMAPAPPARPPTRTATASSTSTRNVCSTSAVKPSASDSKSCLRDQGPSKQGGQLGTVVAGQRQPGAGQTQGLRRPVQSAATKHESGMMGARCGAPGCPTCVVCCSCSLCRVGRMLSSAMAGKTSEEMAEAKV